MAEPENLVLEYLRRLDQKFDVMAEDISEMKYRVSSLESRFVGMQADMALLARHAWTAWMNAWPASNAASTSPSR